MTRERERETERERERVMRENLAKDTKRKRGKKETVTGDRDGNNS